MAILSNTLQITISVASQNDIQTDYCKTLPTMVVSKGRQGCVEPVRKGLGQDTEIHKVPWNVYVLIVQ